MAAMEDVNKEIMDWVNSQPHWVRLAAAKVYAHQEINEDLINELLALLKTPNGQSKKSTVDLSGMLKAPSVLAGDLRIVSIGEIEGIDALAPKMPLPFSPNLSVVYGSNGTGKSGYARIIKKMCGQPNATELLPNVFTSAPKKRQCAVVAKVDGVDKKIVWEANGDPVDELAPVDVFDSQEGVFYIDKEQEVSYVPNEVALFEQLVVIFKKLQSKLKAEQDAIITKLPIRPVEFGNSKYIAAMYDRLKHDSDVSKVEEFFEFTEEDAKSLAGLEERLRASPLELAEKKKKRIAQMQLIVKQLVEAAELVSSKSLKLLEQLEEDSKLKRKVARQAADAIVNETSFDGFGNETWKAMWQAARKYSEEKAYPVSEYPVVVQGAKCVLCEQELDEAAKQRLVKFESYVTGELESSATAAELALQNALNRLPVKPQESDLITVIQAAQLDEENWLPALTEAWAEIEKVTINEKDKNRSSRIHYDLSKDFFSEIEELIAVLEMETQQHNKDAESFNKKSLQDELADLEAKKWAGGYIQAIKEEVLQLKARQKIDEWLKSVNTTAVSKEAGRVSEILVTDAFVERFNNELKLLGASKVSVELIKTKTKLGRVQHKIQLNGLNPKYSKSKAASVLSEGEQRIVALAAFLADVTGKPNSAPFIFDDPISSLDQTYEEQTAKRLISLSADRQVIVFTHRLSLLGQLIEKGGADYRHIRREPWGCGEHGDLPLFAKNPIKAVRDLRNSRLSAARKAFEKDGYDAYYPLAKAICSDFRVLIERIVEFDLLADVVMRHRRAVNTKGKVHRLAKVTSEDCQLIETLMDQFSCFEHSQSDESPVDIPDPAVLDEALTMIIEWHEDFSKR
ncbi:AAA family ATPase [Alcanivorax sp.]|uniref:AAA family ATPase n=1 Tax=Alcanivorax sp. TaxID=1872427 RepID=UPI0025BBBA56|nr:AAA family ATPase [Alcanivorax sp.]